MNKSIDSIIRKGSQEILLAISYRSIETTVEKIISLEPLSVIYLYGSLARFLLNRQRNKIYRFGKSDADLMVVLPSAEFRDRSFVNKRDLILQTKQNGIHMEVISQFDCEFHDSYIDAQNNNELILLYNKKKLPYPWDI
jgi:hypothetical protein